MKRYLLTILLLPILGIAEAPIIQFMNDGAVRWQCVEVIDGEDIPITPHVVKEKALGCLSDNQFRYEDREYRAVSKERIRAIINREAAADILRSPPPGTTAPSSGFSPTTYEVDEDAGPVTLTVVRSNAEGVCDLFVNTANGTASAGTDYTAVVNGTDISYADGVGGSDTIDVSITDRDGVVQGNLDFTATITKDDCPNDTLINTVATVTIVDQDPEQAVPPVWEAQDTLTGCPFDGYYDGARGFGACNRGGATTTSDIYYVTNLNAAGAGSFDEAVDDACADTSGVVVFEVSGTIDIGDRLVMSETCDNVTIAGETAPAPGVFFKEFAMILKGDNVVVSHIYLAAGGEGAWADADLRDNLGWAGPHIVDNHWVQNVTGMWAVDEGFTCYPQNQNVTLVSNVSMHQILIAQPLHDSIHGDPHSKGMLTREECEYFDNIRTVFVHSADRNPRNAGGINRFVANNVVYNWGTENGVGTAATVERNGGIDGWMNFIDNIYIKGPDTTNNASDYYMRIKPNVTNNVLWEADNVLWTNGGQDRDCDAPAHDCIQNQSGAGAYAGAEIASAYPTGYVQEPMPATEADQITLAQIIINNAGARPTERATYFSNLDDVLKHPINRMYDAGDEGQVVDCVDSGTCANHAGGWPTLAENTIDHDNDNHCDGAIPTATRNNVTASGRTVLHEWLLTCQNSMMPPGWDG